MIYYFVAPRRVPLTSDACNMRDHLAPFSQIIRRINIVSVLYL